nr:hypothetical protein [Tanacetum cinerariifolium]
MILESVENGPLIWPTIEENGVTRTKKYAELSVAEKIQADCDMKATNIILQDLPADIYSLERECKLYDAFDKFTHIKVESLHKIQPNGGYLAVPPPITGNFMPPKLDLVFHTALIAVETNHLAFSVKLTPQIAPSFVQSTDQVKPPMHFVQPVDTSIPAATPKPTSPKSNRSGKRKNRKTCFVCKSVDHLIKDCDYHAKKKAQPTPRIYAHRGNHKQYALLTHKKLQNHMAPTAVLTQSKPVFNTTVRPVSAVVPKIMVTRPRLAHSPVTKSKSPIKWHITRSPSPKTSNSPHKVTAVKALVVSAAQGVPDGQAIQTIIPNNVAFQIEDLDTYDSNCDDILNAKAVLMANISNYSSDVISEKARRIKPTLYNGIVISAKHVAMHVIGDEETLILKEKSRSKMSSKEKDPEAIKQKISNKPIDYVKLNKLYEDFRKHFVPQQELSVDEAL